MKYPNSFIRDLAQAEKRMGHMDVMPIRDRTNGFVEVPIEQDPPRERDQAEMEICPLSRRQLQDLQAVTAEVVQIQEGTHFVQILLPDGRRETAYCNYSDGLKIGDELFVTVRQRGRQRTIKLLGLVPPDRKRGST